MRCAKTLTYHAHKIPQGQAFGHFVTLAGFYFSHGFSVFVSNRKRKENAMTDNQPQTTNKRTPDLYIHTKVANGRDSKIGSRIGVGFLHGDGVGVNIILDAQPIPLNGQIELVGFPPKDNA